MIGAICFGLVFGFPFVTWGLFFIFDRDRTWQKQVEKSKSNTPKVRTPSWDRRQIIYGALLITFGIAVFVLFTAGNLAAQTISPPPPM